MLLNEGALIVAARRGNPDAYRTLVERYERPLFSFLYRVVCEQELARDLTQDTFVAAWRSLPHLRNETSFRSWLFTIALNLGRKALRRRRLISWLPWTEQDLPSAEPLDTLPEAQLVHQALARLPVELRTPLVLRVVEGFSYDEISAIMGISQAAAKMRVMRARRLFKDTYEDLNT